MIKTIAETAEYLSAYLLIDDIPEGESSPEFRLSMLRNCQIKPLGAKLLSLVADGQLTARTPTGTSCTGEIEPTESTLIDVAEAKAVLDNDDPFGKLFEDDRAALPGADSPISLSARIENSDSEWPTNAEFAEYVSNGAFINWPYWVGKMPVLTPQQAARLMAGLDPDIFESLDAQPNRNDATQRCTHAKYIERLAIAEQITNLSPSEWLHWADKHEFEVHDAFRDAVLLSNDTDDHAKAAARIYSWPGIAEEQEKARRNAGRYQIREAAEQLQIHAGERAETMIEKLSKAAFEGNLPAHLPGEKARHAYPQDGMVRSNGSNLPGGISYFAGTDWRQHVRDFYEEAYWDDLNAWLAENEPRIDWRFPKPENEGFSNATCGDSNTFRPRIGWQIALFDNWPAMRKLHGREPSAAEAIRYLKMNDGSGFILSSGGDRELWWKTTRGEPKEVQFKTVETCISAWRTSGQLPA